MKTTKTKGDAVNVLPFSLIASEILSRVAGKSDIGRCRCVCKEWKSFLSTPAFNRTHFQSNATIDDYKLLQFGCSVPCFRTFSLNQTIIPPNPNPNYYYDPDDPAAADVSIIASLDGLVCLASSSGEFQFPPAPATFVFWNPFTGAYKKLPSIPGLFFADDPIGFFYVDDDYRLVRLTGRGRAGRAHVYSNRLGSWRAIDFPFAKEEGMMPAAWSSATICGQCLYFTVTDVIVSDRHFFDLGGARLLCYIICFDVNTETFRKIQFPLTTRALDASCTGSLVVLNGRLHLCVSYPQLKQGELWRMEDDDGWVKVVAAGEQKKRICTAASAGNWIAVLDQDDNCFKKFNTEDFTKHYGYFCSPGMEYTSSRVIYVQTLISPILS